MDSFGWLWMVVGGCSRKRLFELSEALIHWCFEKTTSKISAYFAAKH